MLITIHVQFCRYILSTSSRLKELIKIIEYLLTNVFCINVNLVLASTVVQNRSCDYIHLYMYSTAISTEKGNLKRLKVYYHNTIESLLFIVEYRQYSD